MRAPHHSEKTRRSPPGPGLADVPHARRLTRRNRPGPAGLSRRSLTPTADVHGDRSMVRAETYRRGDLVIVEGQRGGEAFVVESGRVEVFRAGPPPLRLAVLGPGQIFGEMALITELPR